MTHPTKLQRHLDLIAFLVGRRFPVSAEQIMAAVPAYARKLASAGDAADPADPDDPADPTAETVRRMFERDKDELRAAGIPLETVSYRVDYADAEGYRITRRDFYLPYLRLTRAGGAGVAADPADAEEDAAGGETAAPTSSYRERARVAEVELPEADARDALDALADVAGLPSYPLRREARAAFRKLAFGMDAELFRPAPVLRADRPGAREVAETVRLLNDALLARKRVRFRYHGIYRGAATDREVEPWGLFFQHGHWYMVGHDVVRGDRRVFRVARMADVVPNTAAPKTPDYGVPEGFDPASYLGREAWELGGEEETPLRARVRFRFPASLLARRQGHGELEQEHDDGSATRVFDVHQVHPFLRWLLSLQDDAVLLDPPELVEELRGLAREVAAIYGTP